MNSTSRVRQVTWFLPLELYRRLEARAEKDSLPGPSDCAMRLLLSMLDTLEAREQDIENIIERGE